LTVCTVTYLRLLYAGELDGELQGGVRRDLARSVGPAPFGIEGLTFGARGFGLSIWGLRFRV
jgi:hypothetical protein